MSLIPVTVFTGYLGSGKTTLILSLIRQLSKDYKVVVLKNEFGDAQVDSALYQESNIQIQEMINGCLCCVLVGKLNAALVEILVKYKPDRIIIETSGSAYPAPIVLELKKLADRVYLNGLITVVDLLNFETYKDTSYTAKNQVQYTDLILLNKVENTTSEKFDQVLDNLNELNTETPKVIIYNKFLPKNLIFDLHESDLESLYSNITNTEADHERLDCDMIICKNFEIKSQKEIINFLASLPKWDFYRIKGIILINDRWYILNYVFGKYDLTLMQKIPKQSYLLFLGKNFSFQQQKIKIFLKLKNMTDFELKLRQLD